MDNLQLSEHITPGKQESLLFESEQAIESGARNETLELLSHQNILKEEEIKSKKQQMQQLESQLTIQKDQIDSLN